jgi:hypothetical protein
MIPKQPEPKSIRNPSGRGTLAQLALPPAVLNGYDPTELSRIRSNYSRATASYREQAASVLTIPPKPRTGIRKLSHAVKHFWAHQISVIVPHAACRDHLGMYAYVTYLCNAHVCTRARASAEWLQRHAHREARNNEAQLALVTEAAWQHQSVWIIRYLIQSVPWNVQVMPYILQDCV